MTIQVDGRTYPMTYRRGQPVSPDSLAHALAELTRERVGGQKMLAWRMDCSPSLVSCIFTGRQKISPGWLNRVLDVCEVTAEERALFNAWAARETGWRF